MLRQNSHVRINQSGAKNGIGSVENLNADQICGSSGNSQPVPERQVADPKCEQLNTLHSPHRSIAIGVNLNQHRSNNSQYNPLENPRNSNINLIAEVVGDFVEAVITSLFGS
jgi:hypothetical protein